VGVLYIRQGRYNEAEPLFVKSLEIRRRILGEEHPDTLKSMTLLGVLRRVQGRNNEAEQLSAKALEIQRRVLGEEHPDTLMTMHNLGWSYLLQKRYSEAEPLLIKSVEIQSRVLGEEYSETLWAMQGLGLLYSNQGRYKEAEPLLSRVLEIRRRVLGEEHPDTQIAMRHLEELHNNLQGRDNEAESKNIVMDAYKMRMQGKVDDANALLVQAIQKNPHNAAAYYELARTRLYMATGDPRKMGLDIIEAQQAIENAIVNDPNNVIYPFFKGYVALFQAYISQTKENNDRLIGAFETALKLKPDCRQAMLYLVEIYATLPDDKGGDKSKAEQYAKKLEGMDKVYGAKARSVLLPADANRVDYWQNVQKVNEGNADVLEELGKAYLGIGDVNNAALCFEKAVKINPEKTILFMDLGIYHTWAALRARDNNDLFQKEIALGDAAVTRYLDCKPILPMQAYALGVRYKYKAHSGHKEQADELMKKAKELDPYFSKATGAPSPDLFIAPDEISHYHRYLFRPIQ
jgi:tetratricopeptide (TPR) repeat protein